MSYGALQSFTDTGGVGSIDMILSHTFNLARNERGLIEDRHFVDVCAAANRYGDLLLELTQLSFPLHCNYKG